MAHNVQAKPEDFTESGSSPPSGAVLSSPPTQPPRQPSRRRRSPRRGRPSGRRRAETPLDPFALARSYIANQARDNKTRRLLRHWRREWWRYRDGHYQTVDEVSVRIGLTHWAKRYIDCNGITDANGNLRQVTGSLVSNVLNALRAELDVPEETTQPAWLGAGDRGDLLAVSNGLLDVARLIQGDDGCLAEPTPEWFSPVVLPVRFDPSAECPRWTTFLDEVLEGDPERIGLLQEWFGYCLIFDTTLQKFLLMEGDGANGKTVTLDILITLLGADNVSHVPLEAFGNRFQLTMTLGKLANVVSEVGDLRSVAEGMLKQFTSGDRMYFDRKGIPGVEEYPTARLVLATNNRPSISDRSSGVWRRMLLMPFRVTIPQERQDPFLRHTLRDELPGIFNWAVEGLRRVRRQKRFTQSLVMDAAQEEYRRDSNPAQEFLQDYCRATANAVIPITQLFATYSTWCSQGGFSPLNVRVLGKELRKRFPAVERKKCMDGGTRQWCYVGVELTQLPYVDQASLLPEDGNVM